MKLVYAALALIALITGGCAHQVTFDRPAPYTISSPRQSMAVTAVIDQNTLSSRVPIRSFMVGAAHSWEVEPGDMLKQVADIELPQMFSDYEFSATYKERLNDIKGVILELAVASYQFQDFRAKVRVNATLYERGKKQLFQKTYSAEGLSQGEKMFWGGPFGMKSAIRQSSLEAYKKVFEQLRPDLLHAVQRASAEDTAVRSPRVVEDLDLKLESLAL